MVKLRYLFLLLWVATVPAEAVVPVADYQDPWALTGYLSQVYSLLQDIDTSGEIAQQTDSLRRLISVQQDIAVKCNNVCSDSDQQLLHSDLNSINDAILTQFAGMGGSFAHVSNNIDELKTLVTFLANLPSDLNAGGTKEVSLTLQQSLLKAQQITQAIIMKSQIITFQQSQQQAAKHKIEQAATNSTYAGFDSAGL